jgi:hypothetical protein
VNGKPTGAMAQNRIYIYFQQISYSGQTSCKQQCPVVCDDGSLPSSPGWSINHTMNHEPYVIGLIRRYFLVAVSVLIFTESRDYSFINTAPGVEVGVITIYFFLILDPFTKQGSC